LYYYKLVPNCHQQKYFQGGKEKEVTTIKKNTTNYCECKYIIKSLHEEEEEKKMMAYSTLALMWVL